jgi:hypothetical protein
VINLEKLLYGRALLSQDEVVHNVFRRSISLTLFERGGRYSVMVKETMFFGTCSTRLSFPFATLEELLELCSGIAEGSIRRTTIARRRIVVGETIGFHSAGMSVDVSLDLMRRFVNEIKMNRHVDSSTDDASSAHR